MLRSCLGELGETVYPSEYCGIACGDVCGFVREETMFFSRIVGKHKGGNNMPVERGYTLDSNVQLHFI